MKIRIMTAAVAAVLSAWSPVGAARQTVVLPYIFGVSPADSVGKLTGLDTTTAGLLTVNNNININTSNDVGGGITSDNPGSSILFVGNSTVTGFTGASVNRFLDISAGANATTVNFNGNVFTTQFHHAGTGTVNFNGNVNFGITASSYIFGGDGFLNIGANKIFTSALTTTAGDNTGTLTLNSGSSVIGAIGAGSAAIKQLNVVGGNASITGAVFVRAIDLGANTLTIDGALTTSAGGSIATTFISDTGYGNIQMGAHAYNITGGAITITPVVTGVLTLGGSPYRIVNAPGGAITANVPITINNTNPRYTFSAGSTNISYLDISLVSITPLVNIVTTPNALKVAPILEVTAPVNTDLRVVQDAIAALPNATSINNALHQLAPAHTNIEAPWVAAQATQLMADTWMSRLDEIQKLCCDKACDASGKKPMPSKTRDCKTNDQQSNFWLKGLGKYGSQGDTNELNGYSTKAVGAMIGYDVPLSETARVGLGAGYVRSNIDDKHSDNRTNIDSYHLTAYFNYAPDAFFVQGAVTAGIDKYDGTRNIIFPGIARQARSDATGHQYSATINAGKHFGLNETTITPLVGLKATRLYVEGYQESGAGDINLRVDSQTYDFLQSSVGLKAERVIQTAKGNFSPEVHAKWLHDFNSTTMEQNVLFTGGGAKFSDHGIVHDRDTYNVGAGVTFLSCNCDQTSWSVKGLYDYKWNGSHYDSHQVSLLAGLRF